VEVKVATDANAGAIERVIRCADVLDQPQHWRE
jgi:hypothetical protein